MLPSVKTLETAFPGKGRIIRRLLESAAAVKAHPAAIARVRECYVTPSLLDQRLHAINHELDGHGIEYITHKRDSFRSVYGLDYVNMGDTYATTVLFDHDRQTWRVTDLGSIVESRRCYV